MSAATEAAARLAKKLPKRTVRCADDPPEPQATRARKVVIGGIVYPSMTVAAAAHGVSPTALYRWVDSGRMRYV